MQQAVVRAAGVAGLAIICGALALGGANDAARAAMLAGALLAATLIVLLARKPAEIGAVALSHAVSLTAAALFVLWALTTAAANPDGSPMSALNHPLWREFGLTNGAISIAPYRTLEGVAGFLAPAAAFALGALVADTRETRNWIGAWLPLACFAFAGFGLWTFFSGPSHARLAAALGSPNAAATALGVMAILLAAAIARAARAPAPPGRKMPPKLRWAQPVMNAPLAIIALIFTAVALALTQSRAGLIATGFAFLALVVLLGPVQSKQRSRAVLLAACVAVGLFAFLIVGANGGAVLERYAGFEKAVAARADVLDVHWRAFLDRPLLGHGLNTFHEINAHYAAPETWGNVRIVGSAHNIFLQAAEETGIVGLLLFAAMLLPPIWFAARRVWLGASGAEWAAGALAATLLCLAHGLTDFGLQVPATAALLAFALGAFAKPPAEPKTFTDALAVTPPKPRRAGDAAAP